MNKRIIFLLVFSISVAFSSSLQAVELYETGNVNIHGFISQGYMQSGGNNFFADTKDDGTFQYSEAGINFTTDVSDRLSLGLQLFSRDLGKMGNHEVTVDWAFADYSFTDWLNLKAGKVKLPYGLYNTERDVDMLRTFVFLPQSIYYEGWRDSSNALNGAGFYGYVEAGFVGSFSYEAYLGNSIVAKDAGVARMLADQTPASMELEFSEMNVEYTNAATLTWETVFGIEGLRIGGSLWAIEFEAESEYNDGGIQLHSMVPGPSGAPIPLMGNAGPYGSAGEGTSYMYYNGAELVDYADHSDPAAMGAATAAANAALGTAVGSAVAAGHYDTTRSRSTFNVKNVTTAISLEYVYDNLVFAAEVMQNDYDLDLEEFINPSTGELIAQQFKTLGWYSSMTYRFTDWLELGTYYSEYYADADDKDGKDAVAEGTVVKAHEQYLKDLCLTARFDISANWILKVEGHQMEGAALLYRDDDNANAVGDADYEKDWYLGAMKLTYSF